LAKIDCSFDEIMKMSRKKEGGLSFGEKAAEFGIIMDIL
jgi:hypothetical protein